MSKKTVISQETLVFNYLQLRTSLTRAKAKEIMALTFYSAEPEAIEYAVEYGDAMVRMIRTNEVEAPAASFARKKMFVEHKIAARFLKILPDELTQMRQEAAVTGFRDGATYQYKLIGICALRIEMEAAKSSNEKEKANASIR